MAELKLNHPRLVAIWPGMGQVATNAGVYLLVKLGMTLIAEPEAQDIFDVDHVEVKNGLIQPARSPRNQFYLWTDPQKKHDLVVFLGETQPQVGKHKFCRLLIRVIRELGIERVVTFAAMATEMRPDQPSRVFGAATDDQGVEELKRLELELIEDGNISGMNGLLLATAAEAELPGVCFLGEMPHIFRQLPFPKASLAILKTFLRLTGISLDLTELAEQAQIAERQLLELYARIEETMDQSPSRDDEFEAAEPHEEKGVSPEDRENIESLFEQSAKDRSKAFELKQTLDRLGAFKLYEDRFLDLFKKPS